MFLHVTVRGEICMCDRAFVTLNVSARVRVVFFSALLDMPLKKEKEKKEKKNHLSILPFQCPM